jgi:hypothetical protein
VAMRRHGPVSLLSEMADLQPELTRISRFETQGVRLPHGTSMYMNAQVLEVSNPLFLPSPSLSPPTCSSNSLLPSPSSVF